MRSGVSASDTTGRIGLIIQTPGTQNEVDGASVTEALEQNRL